MNKKITEIINQKTLKKILIIFMIIQPILDIYYLYTDKIISIFKLSPSTIIRMLFIIIMFILSYLCDKNKHKTKHLISLLVVYILYTIFHHINAINFNKEYSIYYNYNWIKEVFYIIRMLMPIVMIYITKENKLEESNIKKIVFSVINIFCITIIITNLLGISLTSYAGGSKIIDANFLKWFTKDFYNTYTYEQVASKGLFHMANQISAALIALFPIELYFIFKEKISFSKLLTLIFNILAMLMIGTRVASYGWLIVIILMIIEYLYFGLKKQYKIEPKKIIVLVAISLIFYLILPYSPVSNRTYASDDYHKIQTNIKSSAGEQDRKKLCISAAECKQEKIAYIEKYYDIYGFDKEYIVDNYSYKDDTDFWIGMFDIPYIERANHRQLKTMITKRIFKTNNNIFDNIFGISFTRLRNTEVYMENDIYVHYYSIGIIGIILFILPYLFIGIKALYRMVSKKKLNLINCVYLTSIALVFAAGIVSGNVFDEWIVTLFLGFICGILLSNTKNDSEAKKKVLFISSTGGHLEELMQLKPMFNDYDYHIITEKTKSNLSLKKKHPKRVNFLVYGSYTTLPRKLIYPFKLIYNTFKSFILYLIIRPEYIISTGAHTSGPMCLIGHILGSKIIYIETFANSQSKSKTGRIVYKFADLFIVQWESMLELYPNAVYGGWIF